MNAKVEGCKVAARSIDVLLNGIKRKSIPAFTYKRAEGVGEELTHRISGQRYFRPAELHTNEVHIGSCPVKLTDKGYEGIPQEYFEALKKMKITKKEQPYGNGIRYYDEYSATSYWADKNRLGETIAKAESMIGTEGRHNIPTSLWEKIQSFFG